MKGIELGEIRDALVNAFDPDDFDIFLLEHLDFDRIKEVADGPFKKVVVDVLRRADNEGWDPILIAEVAQVRPLKKDVQNVYRKYAAALIDVGRQKSLETSQLKAIEKFRLGPSVVVQAAGVTKTPEAQPGNEQGLQRNVKPFLPMIDVTLWRERLFRLEGRVCRVEVDGVARGTGFLVGPETVITNYHVLRDVIDDRSSAPKVNSASTTKSRLPA